MIVLTHVEAPSDGVHFVQPQVEAYTDQHCCGLGTLTVAESSVTWISSCPPGAASGPQGFALTYPSISLHAISRDTTVFPHECVYLMVDATRSGGERRRRHLPPVTFADISDDFGKTLTVAAGGGDVHPAGDGRGIDLNLGPSSTGQNGHENEENGDDDEEIEEDPGMVEIRFVPIDKSVLDQIFDSMSECQALNPDEEDDFSDNAGEDADDEEMDDDG